MTSSTDEMTEYSTSTPLIDKLLKEMNILKN